MTFIFTAATGRFSGSAAWSSRPQIDAGGLVQFIFLMALLGCLSG